MRGIASQPQVIATVLLLWVSLNITKVSSTGTASTSCGRLRCHTGEQALSPADLAWGRQSRSPCTTVLRTEEDRPRTEDH